jgi:hypothetical protein
MYLSLEAWCRQCIGTTEEYCKPTVPVASVGDLPYKDVKLRLRKPHDETGPEFDEVQQGKHKLKGYTGHIHGHHVNNNDFITTHSSEFIPFSLVLLMNPIVIVHSKTLFCCYGGVVKSNY